MRIAIDALGGDHVPAAPVAGAVQAASAYDDVTIVLVGDPATIGPELEKHDAASHDRIEIHELLNRYAHAIDFLDWKLLERVFSEDAVADFSSMAQYQEVESVLHGREAIVGYYEVAMTPFEGVLHFMSNHLVEIDGDLDATIRFTDGCEIPYIAPSLGGVESLVEMPVLMSYWDYPKEERLQYGITDNLVRLSCGIEDADDLIADLGRALDQV